MRKNDKDQLPLNPAWAVHELAEELRAISQILDENPEIAQWIMHDLSDGADPKRGASGLSGEQVLRCAILKNWHSLSYSKLAFHLADSCSFQAFCRIPFTWRPSKACLQENISRIRPETWQRVNRAVASPIHYPNDSSLLWDGVRVLTRLLIELSEEAPLRFSDHRRRAKRRSFGISTARGKERRNKLYRDLLKVSHWALGYAEEALGQTPCTEGTAFCWASCSTMPS